MDEDYGCGHFELTTAKRNYSANVCLPETIHIQIATNIIRNSVIHRLITREKQYLLDLDLVESDFIKPLRAANPPILPINFLEDFIDEVFGNILDLRECNRRLLEVLNVRQREEGPVILRIGDIFLEAATEFRFAYPVYIGHYPLAEKRLKEEVEANSNFRLFLEVHCSPLWRLSILTTPLKALRSSAIIPFWRIAKARSEAFPQPSSGAPPKVPCASRSCLERNSARKSGCRVLSRGY